MCENEVSSAFGSSTLFFGADFFERIVLIASHAMKLEIERYTTIDTMLTTKLTLPCRLSSSINCAPVSAPAIVPMAMMNPSFKSTLPSARCFFAATIDLPTMCARSVPTAIFHGTPTARSAGPAMKLPPTPKNPPSTPMMKPVTARYAGLISRPEIGKFISIRASSNEAQQPRGRDFKADALAEHQKQCDHCVNHFVFVENLLQPVAEKMEHEDEIDRDDHRVDDELDQI